MELRSFHWQDRAFNRADLEADAAVNAGLEINPVILSSFCVFTVSRRNACHWAGVDAIGRPFADICHDRVGHASKQRRSILVIDPFEAVTARLIQTIECFSMTATGTMIKHTDLPLLVECHLALQCRFQSFSGPVTDQCSALIMGGGDGVSRKIPDVINAVAESQACCLSAFTTKFPDQ